MTILRFFIIYNVYFTYFSLKNRSGSVRYWSGSVQSAAWLIRSGPVRYRYRSSNYKRVPNYILELGVSLVFVFCCCCCIFLCFYCEAKRKILRKIETVPLHAFTES